MKELTIANNHNEEENPATEPKEESVNKKIEMLKVKKRKKKEEKKERKQTLFL